jgi:hypothetical protein
MTKRRSASAEITSTRTVYRVVNGKRKRFTMSVVATDYKPTANTIGVKCGEIRLSNGKVDPTLVPASHK